MTRLQTLVSYALIGVALVLYDLVARRRGRVTFTRFAAALTHWRPTRWTLLAAWLWLGWHVFARVDALG